ncbi:DNA repair protein RecN [Parvularcula oceani]|uniref:DNA repair protein RecN n=1 Tax=Parvularcula oceani TaxID=1247963 RepID=UPI0004E1FC0E|nr:DNA repair protein RecN [Parvularcula oceani]
MLCALSIQDIVLIERLSLNVGEGLTALTGETGAGKSILLDSLGLATGAKAEKGLVRIGAERGVVSATFDVGPDHAVWTLLEENALPTDEELVILRRVQNADGRSRAFVNDQPVSVGLLRQVGEALIEVHGQHQSQGFLNTAAHRDLLDSYGGLDKDVAKVRALYDRRRTLERDLQEKQASREQALREADYLRHVAEELASLDPQEGEEGRLADRRAVLMAAEKVSSDLADAVEMLGDDGLEQKLSSAAGRMERAAARLPDDEAGPLAAAIERLDAALSEFAEARSAVIDAADAFVQDPDEQNEVEERLFALRAAGRKHSRAPDALAAYREEVERQLELIDEGEASFGKLEAELKDAQRDYDKAAAELSAKRLRAGKALDKAVKGELGPLKLGHATFSADIDPHPDEPGPHGIDRVQFLISTNPGAPLGPLKQIASGGELSRFVLALKASLVAKDGKTVIIFDEVDAGVGGAVADAIGERLARIAEGSQVLVVTHSPQVAARGLAHWKVSKAGKKAMTTTVEPLSEDERIEELARMLSGAKVTDEARAAARTLLADSRAEAGRSAA